MTEMSRSMVRCWNTTPSWASARLGCLRTSMPKMRMLPVRLLYRRVIRLNSVVLPAPFWPSSTVKLPGGIAKLTPSSALRLPKLCARPSTSRAGTLARASVDRSAMGGPRCLRVQSVALLRPITRSVEGAPSARRRCRKRGSGRWLDQTTGGLPSITATAVRPERATKFGTSMLQLNQRARPQAGSAIAIRLVTAPPVRRLSSSMVVGNTQNGWPAAA